MTVAAVIVAGGSGLRAGGETPKQYQLIGGKPVIWWTLRAFLDHPEVSYVQVVVGEGHEQEFARSTQGLTFPAHVIGGATRQDSCRLGVEACTHAQPDKILIHDAARPFVSAELISAVISHLDHTDAVIPGMRIAETLKLAPEGTIRKTIDRSNIWLAQTPQGFTFPKILEAHRKAAREQTAGLTDDASVAEHAGIVVQMILGNTENVKLTTAKDIDQANHKLNQQNHSATSETRIGQGIDFHVFAPGKSVWLCGVEVPHTHKLKAHSDGDVALHALTDAILGAIGEGDIGTHFPPSDKQWKDAASSVFIEKALSLLNQRGGKLVNVDITILAEAPKISPHLAAMKQSLSALLNIEPGRIAIKATTTEKMGALGRKEGMAAMAIASVKLPA
ncbi:MAG: bifunctional 2-C-methyl-D-erythritol 4-phosphate cytidylyltransferase/2-C-methyl-D-erythritol 2,4-cyclodiphosphate synthase [Aestuariivirga sp.]